VAVRKEKEMNKEIIYRYLGTNGIIESPVHLEDTYYVRLYRLTASEGYALTNGEKTLRSVKVPEDEVSDWTEIEYIDGQD
jgi:hypothetical protein